MISDGDRRLFSRRIHNCIFSGVTLLHAQFAGNFRKILPLRKGVHHSKLVVRRVVSSIQFQKVIFLQREMGKSFIQIHQRAWKLFTAVNLLIEVSKRESKHTSCRSLYWRFDFFLVRTGLSFYRRSHTKKGKTLEKLNKR